MDWKKLPFVDFAIKHPLWVLCIVAFAMRVFAGFAFWHPDLWEFGNLARNMLAGDGYSFKLLRFELHPSAFMPPGYPFLVASAFLLFGNDLSLIFLFFINCLAGAATVALVYYFCREFMGKGASYAAAVFLAFFPAQIFSVARFHPIMIYTAISVLISLLLLRFAQAEHGPKRIRLALACGLSAGLMCYFRGEYIFIFAILLLWFVQAGTDAFSRSRLLAAGLALFIMLAAITPWTIRNYTVFDRLIPMANSAGFNLWRGHNPWATGTARQLWKDGHGKGGKRLPEEIVAELIRKNPDPDANWEPLVNDRMKELALEFMRDNPARELQLASSKLFYFWVTDTTHSLARSPVFWGPYLLIAPFFLLGLWSLRRRWRGAGGLIYLQLAIATGLAMLFFVVPRYRMTLDPLILAVSAEGLRLIAMRWNLPFVSKFLSE